MIDLNLLNEIGGRLANAKKVVDLEVHLKDNMIQGDNTVAYLGIGEKALHLIMETLLSTSRIPARILDFPSGWGRVTRWLRAAFPEADISAGDVWHEAVDWVAKRFEVDPIFSDEDLSIVNCGEFDLIWSGSLVTHLREEKGIELLNWLLFHTARNGLIILTSHGRKARTNPLPLTAFSSNQEKGDATRIFDAGGYAFQEYHSVSREFMSELGVKSYGHSLISPVWWMQNIVERKDVVIYTFREKGWNNHQDVLVLQKIV